MGRDFIRELDLEGQIKANALFEKLLSSERKIIIQTRYTNT